MSILFSSKGDRRLKSLPIAKIMPNPMQPRKKFEGQAIKALAESIAEYGLIQPITVRLKEGQYQLVAGERRLRAARIAGLEEIPCVIIRADEIKSAELAMVENLQRKNLDLFEEAQAIERLLSFGGITQAQLAAKLGMSQGSLANKLRLLRFDSVQRELIISGGLSERHARALLRLPPEKRTEAISRVSAKGYSVTQCEEYIDGIMCERIVKKQLEKTSDTQKQSEQKADSEQQAKIEMPCEQKPIRTVLIGDYALFYNSLERSLGMMRSAGFYAEYTKTETQDGVNLEITLKKSGGRGPAAKPQ